MSRILLANFGSLDSLKVRMRCGARPCVFQMRCTEVRLTPAALAIALPVQRVISPGGSPTVRATIRSASSSASLGIRDGRVLSHSRPATPSSMNRLCQRQTAVLLTSAVRMTAAAPSPSAVPRTIRARQTCFWALLRSLMITCKRLRSVGLRWTMIPVRIRQTGYHPEMFGNPERDLRWHEPLEIRN